MYYQSIRRLVQAGIVRLVLITWLIFPVSHIIAQQNLSGNYKAISVVDSLIKLSMQQLHIAGLAACRVDSGKMVWAGYYGYQNREHNIPVTSKTLFQLASVSKTITASAIAQLVAQGKVHLDDDINKYLPFNVRNPNFPTVPITIGDLLRHRSSILDDYDYLGPLWSPNQGDTKTPLSTFLKNYLVPGGIHYTKQKNFSNKEPGKQKQYCNVGYALLGYLVECITKQPFDQYCSQAIFQPLGMTNTAWFLKDLDTNTVAMPYHYADSLHQYVACGHNGYPDYPAGTLRTSAEQLAHFLIAWTSNGIWQKRQVFDSTAIQLFTPTDVSLGCYTWFILLAPTNDLRVIYGHNGGDNGVFTFIGFEPLSHKGIIVLLNAVPDFRSETNRQTMQDLIAAVYGDKK